MRVALTLCASKQSTVWKPSIRMNSQQCLPIMPPVLFPNSFEYVEREWCMILKAFLIQAAIRTYSICAKNTLLKEGKWQSIDGIQRESNTGNDGEQDQKTCAKWASRKPSFASSLLHSYSTALLSFFPHSLSLVQIHSIFIELVCFSGGGFGVF